MVNIMICGVPGTGKSTLVDALRNSIPERGERIRYINVSDFAINNDCILEEDIELNTKVLDEDKLTEKLMPILETESNLNIIESIHSDIFPEDIIDHVFVCTLRDHKHLIDRLESRNYNKIKLDNNVQCEIFGEILEAAIIEFGSKLVTQLFSDTRDDIEKNKKLIIERCILLDSKIEQLIQNDPPFR